MLPQKSIQFSVKIFATLLSNGYIDNQRFEKGVEKFIAAGYDINVLNDGGKTILDVAEFMYMLPNMTQRAAILKKYGAKTSQELGVIPTTVNDLIMEGYSGDSTPDPVLKFENDYNADGHLIDVDLFLEENGHPMTAAYIAEIKNAIGLLTDDHVGIGTAFLIAPDLVLVSRHCLNMTKLSDLEIKFSVTQEAIKVKGVVEDGAAIGLDYAVLQLSQSLPQIEPLRLSDNTKPQFGTFIGYDIVESMQFTNMHFSSIEQQTVSSSQETYQETSFGLSGAPFLDENNQVYAIHQNAGLDHNESLLIDAIVNEGISSIFKKTSAGIKVELSPEKTIQTANESFPIFHASNFTQYDQGAARSYTLGKNPSVATDSIKSVNNVDNVVCREVLYRWALRGKARYTGNKIDRSEWIDDWKNWEVRVRKTKDGQREWVKLEASTIQMGHKLGAVSYWVHGYAPGVDPLLKQFYKEYKDNNTNQKYEAKKIKYAARYAPYTESGHARLKRAEPDGLTNRLFMYDSKNYRFEWKKLNEQNGREDKNKLQYSAIGENTSELKKYRALRNDDGTTPALKQELINKYQILNDDVKKEENHSKFKQK